jgi:hypothetical protein
MRDIAILAVKQYQAWQELARVWPLLYDDVDSQERCEACGIGVISINDRLGVNRIYTEDERLALVVGHLRNHHRDLEETVYKEAGIT